MANLLEGDAEAITLKAIGMAKDGDLTAIRLCFDRLYPPRKDSPVEFDMPKIVTTADTVEAVSSVIAAVATGELTPSEGQAIAGMIETMRRTIELEDISRRLAALENAKS